MTKELIIATKNKAKVKEFQQLLPEYDIKTMADICPGLDIVEDGSSFEENALLKAKAVSEATKKMTIADDSGLVIDYLNGEPGIYSARYLGQDTAYEVKNPILLERMKDAVGEQRSARFVCALALVIPGEEEKVFTGVMEGQIAMEPAGENGFGYDPIFYILERGLTAAQISPEEKNAISHRGQALRKLVAYLSKRS